MYSKNCILYLEFHDSCHQDDLVYNNTNKNSNFWDHMKFIECTGKPVNAHEGKISIEEDGQNIVAFETDDIGSFLITQNHELRVTLLDTTYIFDKTILSMTLAEFGQIFLPKPIDLPDISGHIVNEESILKEKKIRNILDALSPYSSQYDFSQKDDSGRYIIGYTLKNKTTSITIPVDGILLSVPIIDKNPNTLLKAISQKIQDNAKKIDLTEHEILILLENYKKSLIPDILTQGMAIAEDLIQKANEYERNGTREAILKEVFQKNYSNYINKEKP